MNAVSIRSMQGKTHADQISCRNHLNHLPRYDGKLCLAQTLFVHTGLVSGERGSQFCAIWISANI
jgi:hypothetical protein